MSDERERRYGRPGKEDCQHVWHTARRVWSVRASFGELDVTEDSSTAYTNDDRHRRWAIYICALCDLREAIEIPA